MQSKRSIRTITKGFAHLALGLSFFLVRNANAKDTLCEHPVYVESEYDLFSDDSQNPEFRRMDLATIVVTNDGALPAKVTVSFYDEACLARPSSRDQDSPACELLDEITLEVHPGTQDLSILHLGSMMVLEQSQRVASRVRIEYVDYREYMAVVGDNSGFQSEEFLDFFTLGVQVDIYRNLRAVDCRRADGVADATEVDRNQSLIQNVRFKNFISYEDYLSDFRGITAQIRRRPRSACPKSEPGTVLPKGVTGGIRLGLTEGPPRDHDAMVIRFHETEGAWVNAKVSPKRVTQMSMWDESTRRKDWQDFVEKIKLRSPEERLSKFLLNHPEGTTQEIPVPIRGTAGFAQSLQAR